MDKRFPIPAHVRTVTDFLDFLDFRDTEAGKQFLRNLRNETLKWQAAVSDYVDVEYFENMRDKADELMADARTETAKAKTVADNAAETRAGVLSRREDTLGAKTKEFDERRKEQLAEIASMNVDAENRAQALDAESVRNGERAHKLDAENKRLSELETKLTEEMDKIKQAKALFA